MVILHGFGSRKADYAPLALHGRFDGHDLVFLDAPGCGASSVADPAALSIPFLVDVALGACDALGVQRFHLVGHSMGGLTGLCLAAQASERVRAFTSVEGNVAPEDCFLSRQIIAHAEPDPAAFLAGFVARVKQLPEPAARLYALSLAHKVGVNAVAPIFRSMVEISDTVPLFETFVALPFRHTFIHGALNAHLSYLPRFAAAGVDVVAIPGCGHFPMYANPTAFWDALAAAHTEP
ncbi:MAG: alpha/beta fold hydrolase [Pseudomonadota bacterium]